MGCKQARLGDTNVALRSCCLARIKFLETVTVCGCYVVHVCSYTGEVFVLRQRGRGPGKWDDVSSTWRGGSNSFGWWVRIFQMDGTQCTELV